MAINCALSQIIDSLLASLPTQFNFPACLSFLAAFSSSPITSHSDAAIKHRHLLVRISMDACALYEMFHCPLSEDSNHAQGRIQLDSKWIHICSCCCCCRCGCSFCFVAIDEFLLCCLLQLPQSFLSAQPAAMLLSGCTTAVAAAAVQKLHWHPTLLPSGGGKQRII